jgi:hypothetical protein
MAHLDLLGHWESMELFQIDLWVRFLPTPK